MTKTKEEAISNLESLYNEIYNKDSDRYTYAEAIDMAIEALKANVVSHAVSREDYHNLLTALDDIDRALREYQAKEEQLSAESVSREPLDIFARMYRAERESARSGDTEVVSADDVSQLNFGTPITTTESLADVLPMEWSKEVLSGEKQVEVRADDLDLNRAECLIDAPSALPSAEARPYCVLEPRLPFRKPKTWHEKNDHTYICGDCGFEQAIYGNIDEYNCCPRCGIYKEYVDYGCMFPQKRTPYREDGEE